MTPQVYLLFIVCFWTLASPWVGVTARRSRFPLRQFSGYRFSAFWLRSSVISVLTSSYLEQQSQLPDSFRVGMVTLMHKDNDKTRLKNWERIMLVDFDDKLFNKSSALRMSLVLEELIHPDQPCDVPDHDRPWTTSYWSKEPSVLQETETSRS